jgi:hypothetical protein
VVWNTPPGARRERLVESFGSTDSQKADSRRPPVWRPLLQSVASAPHRPQTQDTPTSAAPLSVSVCAAAPQHHRPHLLCWTAHPPIAGVPVCVSVLACLCIRPCLSVCPSVRPSTLHTSESTAANRQRVYLRVRPCFYPCPSASVRRRYTPPAAHPPIAGGAHTACGRRLHRAPRDWGKAHLSQFTAC